jgi:hypothetical protein
MDAFWPIVILWVVLTVVGARKKKPRSQAPVPPRPRAEPAAGRGQGGFLEEMKRALEEMQRAAEEEERRRAAGGGAGGQASAEAWLETRRQETRATLPAKSRGRSPAPARRKPVQRPQRPLEDDDADKSSEDPSVASMEGVDYDADAERIAEERARAADRGAREEVAASAMSSAQLARRGGRQAVALGGAAEHAEWHRAVATAAAPAPAKAAPRRNARLSRWADGSLLGALVLSEVLGRPPGDR